MFAIDMRNITKYFGNFKANDSIDLTVRKGEIHALVGENGAGKSTLMKVLYGIHQPDSGEIFVNGQRQLINSPSKAISLGIGMVHQHFMLIPPLTVNENIILGSEPTKGINILDLEKSENDIRSLTERYGLTIDPKAKIENLSVGLQQRVEILKILYRDANILILDEPTPVLTPQEVEQLFTTLRNLKSEGKTVIIITHKLREVIEISDTVTVLRRGLMINRVETKSTGITELARMMVGKEIEFQSSPISSSIPESCLVVENLSVPNDRLLSAVKNISFSIGKGEILGIAAVEGNGQSELVEAIAGLRKSSSGKISINGCQKSEKLLSRNVAHIPEDRLKRGLVLDFSLSENLMLGRHHEKGFSGNCLLLKSSIEKYSQGLIDQYNIQPPKKEQLARYFSGGNQQKGIIARELSKDAPVIIASKPTRGLDIGATKFVHDALLAERAKGKAILLVSSDLEELILLSDRIAVMYEGEIAVIFKTNETSEQLLGIYMTGAKKRP